METTASALSTTWQTLTSSANRRRKDCAASAAGSRWFIFPIRPRRATNHDALGQGDVPLAGLASCMKEIGYTELPMLEVISPNPDPDIADSCRPLQEAGFGG